MAAVGRVSGPVGQISGAVDRLGTRSQPTPRRSKRQAIARHTTIIDNAGAALKAAGGSLVVKMGEAMIAYEGMRVAAEGIGQAMDQAHERMRMNAAGMSPAEIEDAEKLSSDIVQQYPSITQSDAMALARNARASFGSYETAKELLPEIAQSYVIAQAAKPNADPEQVREDYELLIKGLEIKGVTQDPAGFKKMMEGINKGINAFGDTLKTSDYYQMIKYARQAAITLSTDLWSALRRQSRRECEARRRAARSPISTRRSSAAKWSIPALRSFFLSGFSPRPTSTARGRARSRASNLAITSPAPIWPRQINTNGSRNI